MRVGFCIWRFGLLAAAFLIGPISHADILLPPKPTGDLVVFKAKAQKRARRGPQSQVLPQASFVFTDAKGVTTVIELRCVHGRLADEPYYCEVVRRVQGVEMGAHAIYPRQLQSIFARFWLERGEAAGAYPPYDDKTSLKWDWRFFEQSDSGTEGVVVNIPTLRRDAGLILPELADATSTDPILDSVSPSQQRHQSRAAYWLFGVLRAWSNFSG